MNERTLRIGICSSYAPRACGLATFTADLEQALVGAAGIGSVAIIRMTNQEDRADALEQIGNEAPTSILVDIAEEEVGSYRSAGFVANTSCDVIIVQHEFGIFGGSDGESILTFMDAVRVPIVLTLHTVLPSFSPGQLATLRKACELSNVITVFTPAARHLLVGHGVAPSKIVIVPHGAPDVLYEADRAGSRESLGLQENFVMSTFGLVSPGKGLELAIAALPHIVAEIPETVFVVAGRTHPGVHRHAGEAYRSSLVDQVGDLGLGAHIRFVNSFLPIGGIAELLAATDVFVTPYVNLDQIVSGALTFALAAGCPVVSTDYRYARDQLGKGAGTIVGSRDSQEFANAVLRYARNSEEFKGAQVAAHRVGAAMHWSTVGSTMAEICQRLEAKARRRLVVREEAPVSHPANSSRQTQLRMNASSDSRLVARVGTIATNAGESPIRLAGREGLTDGTRSEAEMGPVSMKELRASNGPTWIGAPMDSASATLLHPAFAKLRTLHLERLTDDTGIIQHATGSVPLLSSGYCVDDVARLIPVARTLAEHEKSWETVVSRSVAFLGHAVPDRAEAWQDNFDADQKNVDAMPLPIDSMLHGTGPDTKDGPYIGVRMHNFLGWDRRWLDEPCFGDHVGRAARGLASVANDSRYNDVALTILKRLWNEWPKKSPLHPTAYAILAQTEAPESSNPRVLAAMVADLLCAYDQVASASWCWFEPKLRYDYALFPHALLAAGMATKNVAVTDLGLRTLRWLDDVCDDGDFYRFPGCLGLVEGGDVGATGDEQPLEALALAQAHRCAYELTNDPWHRSRAIRCHEWFLGRNRRGQAMVDSDGGCFDGLEAFAANRNQGAESTLAYCASVQLVSSLSKHQERQDLLHQIPRDQRTFALHVSPDSLRGKAALVSTSTF